MKLHFKPYGDRALLIEWEQRIDPAINSAVIRLSRLIEAAKIEGVQFCIPAYCSLTVGFQPQLTDYAQLCRQIQSLSGPDAAAPTMQYAPRKVTIPVCYESRYAPDLPWVSQQLGLDPEYIIHLHTHTVFRVYMLGFMPGFPYLGTLPKVLDTPRKTAPRLNVPAGSVGLAGLQTGIYPIASPGGWQIIGRTPLKIFDPEREEPFLLNAGDEVRFEAVGESAIGMGDE
jgi:KipI family sensor histidine kinase inhibitor